MRAADLADRLGAVLQGEWYSTTCPAHMDTSPSCNFKDGDRGIAFHCFAGCASKSVADAMARRLNVRVADFFFPPTLVATYDYLDEQGDLLFQTVRYDPKDFKQRRPDGQGGWIWNLRSVRRVLYRLPTLRGQTFIFVTEGEKDADALVALGFPATTCPMGAGKWKPEYSEQLRAAGVEYVVIVPDHDPSGTAHARQVAAACRAVGLPVRLLNLPGLPAKGDVSDWLGAGHTAAELTALVAATPLDSSEGPGPTAPDPEQERPAAGERPEICVTEGDLSVITAAAWDALRTANESAEPLDRLYRRDRRLTRVERDDLGTHVLVPPLTPDQLRHRMIAVAYWYRLKKGEPVAARPPRDVLTNMLADPEPPVPTLLRLTSTPFFTASGVLVTTPGYNAESRLLYVAPPGFALPTVPETPTAADLTRARTLLMDDVMGDFPFTGPAERATAAAFYLTLFARELIGGSVPLFEFEKPTIGTGCTLCVQALALAALGKLPDPLTVAEDDAENRKLITATLLAGSPVLWFDNVTTLDSGTFARALTSEMWGDRLLGKNNLLSLVNRALWVTTGNNPTISAEILRRSVRGRMDARVEKPWERPPEEFRHPELLEWVRAERGSLVWAGLTLVQGWLAAGRPPGSAKLASFEVWARTLSGILAVADIPGLLENKTALFDRASTRDAAMRALVVAWWGEYRGLGRSTRELANRHPDEVEALDLGGGSVEARHVRLGLYLKTCQDKTYAGVAAGVTVQLIVAGAPGNATVWQLRPVA